MNKSVLILGRQPELGTAELESLYGATSVRMAGDNAVLVELPYQDVDFRRLGGSVKLGEVLAVLEQAGWNSLEKYFYKLGPLIAKDLPEGKIQLGLSAYGFSVTPKQLMANGLTLKKILKKAGRSVRLSPNTEPALSSAQVTHNHLTGERGCELIIIRDGARIIIARARAVQNISSYTRRDRERPKRDAKVGMLPPKLAQLIINLATADKPAEGNAVLDPFCGTGVVLQEAALMGYALQGTDLEPRMIDYTAINLEWLTEQYPDLSIEPDLAVGDATTHTWNYLDHTIIAGEGYLGQPFNTFPPEDKLRDVIQTCNQIAKGFLKNLGEQIKPGTRICIALPAWQKKPGEFIHLPMLDQIDDLGYNRISFEHARGVSDKLIYARDDQVVARELLIITRK